jgi:hypothetical protein
MKIGKLLLKVFFALMFLNTLGFAAEAMPGVDTFTQPDGSKFEGVLKGDSAFNWIESNGNVILYNKADKFYYKAIYDADKGFVLTNVKPQEVIAAKTFANQAPKIESNHSVSKALKDHKKRQKIEIIQNSFLIKKYK